MIRIKAMSVNLYIYNKIGRHLCSIVEFLMSLISLLYMIFLEIFVDFEI